MNGHFAIKERNIVKNIKANKSKISRRKFLKQASSIGIASVWGSDLYSHLSQEPHPIFMPYVRKLSKGERLNVVTILSDSFRYDHVGFHGNSSIKTPNIDTFAMQSQVFDKAYASGFPTVLNRAEMFTGRYMFHRIGWDDIPAEETVLASILGDKNYITGLVFDTWHLKDHGFFFDRGFQSWEWIRGQEGDRYRSLPLNPLLPCSPEKLRDVHEVKQHLRNTAEFTTEDHYCTARTILAAIDWLTRNAQHGDFYLHVDCFDPHEPWDPPSRYVALYDEGYEGERVISPAYAPSTYLTEAELTYAKALYSAEISFVDHWLGVFFEALDDLNLSDSTLVLFCSDHGFLLGEHGNIGKSWDHLGHYQAYPLYEELVHVPLMIRVPGEAHRRYSTMVQPIDILPTIVDYAGIPLTYAIDGMSLRSVISNPQEPFRQIAVSARSLNLSLSLKPMITVSDGEWALLYGGAHAASELYNLAGDPKQQDNLIEEHCGIARSLHTQLTALLNSLSLSEEKLTQWSAAPCG